jgi:O-antigen ligase
MTAIEPSTRIRALARWLLRLEPLVLAVTLLAFWHHAPPIRDQYTWLLLLAPLFAGLRLVAQGRLLTPSWLALTAGAFVLLSLWNWTAAPLRREDYWVVMSRPLVGMWLALYLVEVARDRRDLSRPAAALLLLGLAVGLLGLLAVQWTEKSALFADLLASLPQLDRSAFLPDMLLSFNVNEIAGMIAWLLPFTLGLVAYRWPPWRVTGALLPLTLVTAGLLAAALLLGQSRMAIAGVLAVLPLLIWGLVPRGPWRWRALGLVALLILLEGAIVLAPRFLPPDSHVDITATDDRDENSVVSRAQIWRSSLAMMRDQPATGVGMAMFRAAVRNEPYIVPYFRDRTWGPPHAHNETLQAGADLGIGGMALYAVLLIGALLSCLRGWYRGDPTARVLALAVATGLLAHAIYGLADAIPWWDRGAFIGWALIGLAAGLGVIHRGRQARAVQQPHADVAVL